MRKESGGNNVQHMSSATLEAVPITQSAFKAPGHEDVLKLLSNEEIVPIISG